MKTILFGFISSLLISFPMHAQKLDWVKTFEGGASDRGDKVLVDEQGAVYTAGRFAGELDFDPSEEQYTLNVEEYSLFLQKMDSNGTLEWATAFTSNLWSGNAELALGNNSDLFVAGEYRDTLRLIPGLDSLVLDASNNENAFIARFSIDGDLLWITELVGDVINVQEIEVLKNDALLITGNWSGMIDLDPGVNEELHYSGLQGGSFYTIIDVDGMYTQSGAWAGGDTSKVLIRNAEADSEGGLLFTGMFGGTVDFDPKNGIAPYYGGELGVRNSAFVVRLEEDGDFDWLVSMKSENLANSYFNDIVETASGSFMAAGGFNGNLVLAVNGQTDTIPSNGENDMLVAGISENGQLLSVTGYGSGLSDWIMDIHTRDNRYWTVGSSNNNIHFMEVDVEGDVLHENTLNGDYFSEARSLFVDEVFNIHIAGMFQGEVDFNPDPDQELIKEFTQSSDVFVMKLADCYLNVEVIGESEGLLSSELGTSYQWINCATNELIPGAILRYYEPNTGGNYRVAVKNGRCADTSDCISFIPAGIEGLDGFSTYIYPNPSNGQFQVSSDGGVFTLYSAIGHLVDTRALTSGANALYFDLPEGIYAWKLESSTTTEYGRLVIDK